MVGDAAWYTQYAPGGRSDRFRGSPEKIHDVANSWRHAGSLIQRFLEDAQAYASTAGKAHSGEAANAFQAYFKHHVGFAFPPAKAQQDEPLVTNLVAACTQLAKACDRYAEHVAVAKVRIQDHKNELFRLDIPWDQPMFGGNGFDGGLHDAVLSDPWIHDLGEVAHALDASAARVTLPDGEEPGTPTLPGLPFLPRLFAFPCRSRSDSPPTLPPPPCCRSSIPSTPAYPSPTLSRRYPERPGRSPPPRSSSSARGRIPSTPEASREEAAPATRTTRTNSACPDIRSARFAGGHPDQARDRSESREAARAERVTFAVHA